VWCGCASRYEMRKQMCTPVFLLPVSPSSHCSCKAVPSFPSYRVPTRTLTHTSMTAHCVGGPHQIQVRGGRMVEYEGMRKDLLVERALRLLSPWVARGSGNQWCVGTPSGCLGRVVVCVSTLCSFCQNPSPMLILALVLCGVCWHVNACDALLVACAGSCECVPTGPHDARPLQ